MIAFITSLRHPRHSESYESVLGLLDQTLDSVCNQTSRQFAVIVVCNQRPRGRSCPREVEWVEVDFPPPCESRGPRTGMEALRLDRGTKYAIGLAHARALSPDHVMFFDADDFVSRRLAEFANQRPQHPGWYVTNGYAYDSKLGWVGNLSDFHQVCGTSHIVSFRMYDAVADIPPDASQSYILDHLDHEYVFRILGSHRWLADHCARRGAHLDPLPFPGAVYHVGHGENHTARATLWTRLVDSRIEADASFLERIRHQFTIPYSSSGTRDGG